MTLVGKSLQDLNKGGPGGHMTIGCAISCGIQCLEALEGRDNCATETLSKSFCLLRFSDLHNIGYLHRDVKPDLNKGGPGGHMTIGCAISCGIQCLEALEGRNNCATEMVSKSFSSLRFSDLHNIGYLHRDVKPGNYTIGRAELRELRKIYILDFGMCRKFTNDQSTYCAKFFTKHSSNTSFDLRKDDCETWVYMLVEFTYGRLPWKEIQDMNQYDLRKDDCETWVYMLVEFTYGRLPWKEIQDMNQVPTII
ncbi:unnamed protein product [Strongylus vulgaris]|uniref:non-specific serine/threonine protein kinase n=1 Tax=Strongylus vulgaris TaxID=40348 RepID=A0A3P7JP50_STRVU|nr:unnamed protein product [Strongylus vulgaris]